MKLVVLSPKPDAGADERLKDALDTIDALRDQVLSGKIHAFIGVSIEADDTTCGWCFRPAAHVSRLRTMGAVASLQACLHSGDI